MGVGGFLMAATMDCASPLQSTQCHCVLTLATSTERTVKFMQLTLMRSVPKTTVTVCSSSAAPPPPPPPPDGSQSMMESRSLCS